MSSHLTYARIIFRSRSKPPLGTLRDEAVTHLAQEALRFSNLPQHSLAKSCFGVPRLPLFLQQMSQPAGHRQRKTCRNVRLSAESNWTLLGVYKRNLPKTDLSGAHFFGGGGTCSEFVYVSYPLPRPMYRRNPKNYCVTGDA